ncbi:MAG: hypothetical protein HOP32_02775 [Nitrospira sp.]|nr:hypothetical protein [Nitrospira sp.]
MRYPFCSNLAQRLALVAALIFLPLIGGCSGKGADAPTPDSTSAPTPAVTSSASYYLAGSDIVADGHGRISLDKLDSGAVRISARINQTDAAHTYRLTLQEVGKAGALTLDIDGATGYGEQTFTTDATGAPLVFDTLLRLASIATVTDPAGRTKMSGSVGADAIELITDLSIAGIQAYIARHGVREVKDILSALPPTIRSNYTLVAQTSGLQAASEAEPRIVMFGADGRFLLSVQSAPGPKREMLEIGELQSDGRWIFREIQVATNTASGESCVICHGAEHPRPIWHEYNQWPGVFGADGDTLTSGEADAITRIKASQANSDRFHILPLHHARAGDIFSLPHRQYPYTNFNATTEIVRAVTEGVWKRIRTSPHYKDLRTGFFLNRCSSTVRVTTNPYWARFRSALDAAGERTATDDKAILRALGINDPVAALQLSKKVLDLNTNDSLSYNQASTSLLSFVHFLALDDWIKDQPELGERLARLPDLGAGYVGNVYTGHGLGQSNLESARRYRMQHNFGLSPEDLQRSRERHTAPNYSDGVWRIEQGVLTPAQEVLCNFLEGR